jgi:hypothetical protein
MSAAPLYARKEKYRTTPKHGFPKEIIAGPVAREGGRNAPTQPAHF